MAAHCFVDRVVWHRPGHCVLLSAGAAVGGFENYAAVSQDVVLADMVFTATAVVMQPVTGIALSLMVGFRLSTPWLVLSMVLYGLVGCCWLPVVWLQMRMRDLAIDATHRGQPLPRLYDTYYRRWFMLGWPAFIGVLIIFYLMVAKPVLSAV